jgi:hypothetical protein
MAEERAMTFAINTTKAAVWAGTTNIARFAWVHNPKGNKIELWESKA